MTIKNLISLLAISLLLFGCAQNQGNLKSNYTENSQENRQIILNATKKENTYVDAIKNSLANGKSCNEAAFKSTEAQLVLKEVLYKDENSSNKIELMSTNKKISQSQNIALQAVLPEFRRCRNLVRESMSSVPHLNEVPVYFANKSDYIYAKLTSKEWSIAQANQARSELNQEVSSKMLIAVRKLTDDLRNEAQQEVSLLLQQQAINNSQAFSIRQQQSQQQQQGLNQLEQGLRMLNNPRAASYAPQPPMNINCTSTKWGNSVNTSCN
ncbi:hypothetical protein [Limnohabitans sp. TS-CS-82]|uniref:hypothetical protein n=1 Tax=Limnohabitans sp. TS-CS-82 TaxID=2094193 RepID=UPI0011B0D82F|nr:hypothetical protein [Limnohabitans sp. TS-CS-82]